MLKRINERIYVAQGSEDELRKEYPACMADSRFLIAIEAETRFLPIKMQQIDSFCAMLSSALENTPASECKPITICSGSKTAEALTNACLLVGSFLILHMGMTSEEVGEAFQELSDTFVPHTAVSNTGSHHIDLHSLAGILSRAELSIAQNESAAF